LRQKEEEKEESDLGDFCDNSVRDETAKALLHQIWNSLQMGEEFTARLVHPLIVQFS
jgi:uncharacterized protein YpiB (UPF0302 family)